MTARNAAVGLVTVRTARNAAMAAGSQVAGKVATLVWTVLAARSLAQADFGAFFFSLTLGLLLSAVASWGFIPVMSQEASRDRTRLAALYTRAVCWQAVVAVPLFSVAGVVAAALRPPGTRISLALVLAAVLLDMLSETNRGASAAAQDQAGTAKALVLQRFVTAALMAAALLAGGGLVGLSAAFLASSVIGCVAHFLATRSLGVRFDTAALRREPMSEFLRATPIVGLTALVLMVLFRIDAVLLAVIMGDEAVGAYGAAYRLLETVLFVVFALRSAVFPVINATDEPGLVRRGMETGLAAIALVYLPFGTICLVEARPLLALLYGDSYAAQSTDVLRWLAFAPLVYGVAYLANAALQARRHFQPMLLGAVVATVANVGLNLLLIPRYGGTAAAFTTTMSYALEGVMVLLALRRIDSTVRLARPLLESALASAAAAVVLLVLPLALLAELPVAALVYLTVWGLLARRWSPDHLAVLTSVLPARRA